MGVPAKPALWGKLAGQCECDPQFWIHRGLNCKAESLAISFFHERSKEVRFRLTASSFSLVRKGTKSTLRGKTRSAPNAEGRVLRSSVFPLRTPKFTRAKSSGAAFYRPARGSRICEAAIYRCRSNGGCYSWCGHRMAPTLLICLWVRRAPLSAFPASLHQSSGSGKRTVASY